MEMVTDCNQHEDGLARSSSASVQWGSPETLSAALQCSSLSPRGVSPLVGVWGYGAHIHFCP